MSTLRSQLMQLISRFLQSRSFTALSIYMVASLVDYGLRFGSLRIFTNILTPEEIGEVAIFGSWVAIFSIVLNLNLRAGILNARTEFSPQVFKEYISSITTLALLVSGVFSLLILILPDAIYENVFGLSRPMIAFALFVSIINFGVVVTVSIWRAKNEAKLFALQSILNSGYSILLSVAFIAISLTLTSVSAVTARVVGMNVIALLFGGYFIWRRLSLGRVFLNTTFWRYGLALSVPLMAHHLAALVLTRADQILINNMIGEYETGIYSLAYRIGEIPSIMLAMAGSVWNVWFFDRMKTEQYSTIKEKSSLYVLGFGGGMLGFMLIGPALLRIISPPEYWQAMRLVPVIMVGGYWLMAYTLLGNVEQYDKQMRFLAIATMIAAIFNILANIALLSIYGYEVAAWTTVASYFLMFIIHAVVVHKMLKRSYLFNLPLIIFIGGLLTTIAGLSFITL